MSPTNPRKRAAPGASPALPHAQMPLTYADPSQTASADFLQWNQQPDGTVYADAAGYDGSNSNNNNTHHQYASAGALLAPFEPSVPAAATTELARRPRHDRQLVPTAPRVPYDAAADPWPPAGDDAMRDASGAAPAEESDNIERLEERAAMAKRDSQSKRKQIPPFVQKLSSFLDGARNTELIRWSERGDSFVVLDEDEFAKTLIPELFKHNNYASFVRQLNMYGFHKRVGLSDNSMKASERKNKSPSEYYNPYFKRGHPNLLWLINKPKGGSAKSKKARLKHEDGHDGDSDDDAKDVEEVYGHHVPPSRALSALPEAGPLQRREVTALQNQLSDIQKQQGAITSALARLRKDHNHLFNQSLAFQSLHDRHENSINAILTFLATVYNRSLDGQNPPNIAQMFANAIPPKEQPHPGSVVDIGDVSTQAPEPPRSVSPHRRPQRLLMAPPHAGGRARTRPASASAGANPPAPPAATIEELCDSPSPSPHRAPEPGRADGDRPAPRPRNIMSLIHDSNAQDRAGHGALPFPEMLSHYEQAHGTSPLTSEQRTDMLNLMATTTAASGRPPARASPPPPPAPAPPSLEELGYTQQEIDELMRLHAEQERSIHDVTTALAPLTPAGAGSVADLDGDAYFPDVGSPADPQVSNLDLDQYLDAGAFYTGSSPMAPPNDYDFHAFGDAGAGAGAMGDGPFDVGMDDVAMEGAGARVESLSESAVHTPEVSTPEDVQAVAVGMNGVRSPGASKRQRQI